MDEPSSAAQSDADDCATSRIEAIRTRAMLEEVIDGTTGRHRFRPQAIYVRWAQRVLSWFRKS